MGKLQNRIVIVTGGASGIGRGCAELFAAEGARVVVADIREDRGSALAKELGAFGVNVNAVAPGLIETAMLKGSDAPDKIIDLAMGESALKRVGQPEDLAYLVAFLASDRARHITGEVMYVDSGFNIIGVQMTGDEG